MHGMSSKYLGGDGVYQKIVGCARKWQEHWSSPWQYIWPLVVAVQSQEAKSVAKDRTCAQQRKWGEEADCVNARREHLDAKRQSEHVQPKATSKAAEGAMGMFGPPRDGYCCKRSRIEECDATKERCRSKLWGYPHL